MCCGQKRSMLRSNPVPAVNTQARVLHPQSGAHSSIAIRYVGSSLLRVRGPVTGRQYQFSGSHAVHSVDTRDAALLLRTQFFRQTP
jgi:hypothetical protein